MPKEPVSVFISYSRTDSEFVDRLEADLRSRNIRTWVDRRKLEGGQNWLNELEKAIEQCQALLVVLSPEAVASEYVRMEYRYGQHLGKLLIPLDYRPCKVPIDLNGIQWVNFEISNEHGLKDLLIVLSRFETTTVTAPFPSSTQMNRDIATRLSLEAEEPVLVSPQPAPPLPDPNLNDLYRAGVKVLAEGDLEHTATLWQQVLDRDPNFGNGTLALRMEKLGQQLHQYRLQRLFEMAEQAHRAGEWGQEIGAWQALVGLEPQYTQAMERISVAEHNQKYALDYENAQKFAREGDISSAKTQLEMLYQDAPYYGDPVGLAQYVEVQVPISYPAQKAAENRKAEIQNYVAGIFTGLIVFVVFGAIIGGVFGGGTGAIYGSIGGSIVAIVFGIYNWVTRKQ